MQEPDYFVRICDGRRKNGGKIPVWDLCLLISLNYSLQDYT